MEIAVRSSFKKKKPLSPHLWNVLVHMVWLWNCEQARVLPISPLPATVTGSGTGGSRLTTQLMPESTRKEVFFFLLASEVVGQKPNATGDRLFQGVRQKEDRND